MCDTSSSDTDAGKAGLSTAALTAWLEALPDLDRDVDDAERIDQIAALERLKGAVAAAQARVTADFAASQREQLHEQGVPSDKQARPIGAQLALARHDSPYWGNRHLGLSEALVHEMPHTLAALQRGDISEWRATIMVRDTACLSRDDRRQVDAELADRLPKLGNRRLSAEARKVAYRLDPASVMRRVRGAEADRRVTLRPAPDAMSLLTGFLPVAAGVAAHVALTRHADAAKAAGDERSRGQIMADELVARLTGQPGETRTPAPDPCSWNTPYPAPAPTPPPDADPNTPTLPTGIGLDIQLVMTDTTLFTGEDTPATLVGYGPIPAAWSATPGHGSGSGSAGSTPTPPPAPWSPWNPAAGSSPTGCASSPSCATNSAAPPGATPPSDTSTTPNPPPTTGKPAPPTAKDSANTATTSKKPPAGAPDPAPTAPSPPPHPPATPTSAECHPYPATGRRRTEPHRSSTRLT